MIIHNDSCLELTDEQIIDELKKMMGSRFDSFSMRYTIKILITKNYDVVGLIATGKGNGLASMMDTGVDIWEIGNLKTGDVKR